MVLTNLAQTAMTATDVIFMGRLSGDTLAAGALGSNLYLMTLIFGLGLVYATSPVMAAKLGAKRHCVREMRRTTHQGLWLAVMIALPIWLFLWKAEDVLLAMGQQPALAAQAGAYVRCLQWAVLPFYGFVVLRAFVSALERPGWTLLIMVLAVVLNAFCNWLLMFGNLGFPALGIAGAGMATSLASLFMFTGMASIIAFNSRFRRYRLFGRFWQVDWPRLVALVKLGAPISAMLAFEVTVFNAAAFLMGLIEPAQLAAHSIAMQITSITFAIPLGLEQAATVRVGLAYGARDAEGISRSGWTAFVIGVSFMAAMALIMLVWPKALIGVFIDIDDPANNAIVAFAGSFLALAALFQVADGAQAVGAGMLRGMQDTRQPMLCAALGYWGIGVPIGATLAFPFGLEGNGIWIGLCSGLVAVAALLLVRWTRRERLGLTKLQRPLPDLR
ncbi:MATE family efflux transporter [Mesorhizobium sp.]|uniref:MATE family efflux transporter n=1 Tax=Mesorhizobium sp. TaxID=1871066 RepID=UPI000FE730AB|nr:MATE family efflux transporter [Mesorhizobium sp.]RWM21661.1 MAG: MATE family efflux transporter [Mesorhizobium sp.]